MQYLISFLEGIVTFISPCLLPMLPVYVTYFAGGGQRTARRTLGCAAGFVLGFTVLFVAMGALAGTVGSFLTRWQTAVNIVCGLVVVVFGLDFLGVLRLDLFRGQRRAAHPTGRRQWRRQFWVLRLQSFQTAQHLIVFIVRNLGTVHHIIQIIMPFQLFCQLLDLFSGIHHFLHPLSCCPLHSINGQIALRHRAHNDRLRHYHLR